MRALKARVRAPTLATLLALALLAPAAHAQSVIWTRTSNGPSATPSASTTVGNGGLGDQRAATVDPSGNLIVTGRYTTATGIDGYLAKYDRLTGNLLWDASFSGDASSSQADYGAALATDAAGNVYLTGAVTLDITGMTRMRVSKHHPATGVALWTRFVNASSWPGAAGIGVVVLPDGHAVTLSRSTSHGNPVMSVSAHDPANGDGLWQAVVPGDPVAILVDPAGNIIIAGNVGSGENSEISVVKLLADPNFPEVLWEGSFSEAGGVTVKSAALDAEGNVVVTGVVGADGTADLKIVKFSGADGAVAWHRTYSGGDGAISDVGNVVAIDSIGDVVVAGRSTTSKSTLKVFKHAAGDGALRWERDFEPSATFDPRAITVDANDDILVSVDWATASSSTDLKTFKLLGQNGAVLWSSTHAGSAADRAAAVLPVAGAVYVVGESTEPNATRAWRISRLANPPPASVADFNADGDSDLLWRHSDGRAAIWLMNGTASTTGREIIGAGTGWNAALVADFNGDGKSDVAWQHTDGRIAIHLMNGTTPSATQQIVNAGAWSITHAPDLNGDGKADLVFRNADGSVAVWTMNGAAMSAGATILGANSGWRVIRTADFDGDGKHDLLWKHADGRHAIWLMDGIVVKATAQILNAGGWTAMHTPDLNGDGKADIVWQHADGTIAAWLMNGTAMASGATLLGAGSGWSVTRTGDFDGDGKADLLFLHSDGRSAIYLMDGLTPTQTTQILNAGGGWSAKRVQDMNGDGKSDIVWENVDGRVAVWLMNGTTMTSGASILGTGTGWSVSPVSQ